MFCKNCGQEIDDLAAVCIHCGVAVGNGVKFCQNCGSELPEEAAFCIKCGGKTHKIAIVTHCKKCGAQLKPGSVFCHACGNKLAPDTCPNCGKEYDSDDAFCSGCGKALKVTGEVLAPTSATEPVAPESAEPSK